MAHTEVHSEVGSDLSFTGVPAKRTLTDVEVAARLGAEFHVTASVGVACSGGEGIADGAALIAAADEAAYVSKFNGKNRTTVWPIEPSVRDAIDRQRAQAQGR